MRRTIAGVCNGVFAGLGDWSGCGPLDTILRQSKQTARGANLPRPSAVDANPSAQAAGTALWMLPMAGLLLALGGAYAVLGYVHQTAVGQFGCSALRKCWWA